LLYYIRFKPAQVTSKVAVSQLEKSNLTNV